MNPCRLITRLPQLLDIAGDTVKTSLPVDQLPDLLAMAARVRPNGIERYFFFPPDIPRALDADALALIRSIVRDPFPAPSERPPGATLTPGPSGPPQPTPASPC